MNLEENLVRLRDELMERTYKVGRSTCFIIEDPVKREIFAADFRDRVVHHLVYNYIMPVFERTFIVDSYSCRKGKGTLYGVKRLAHHVRSCSRDYTDTAYALKMDIQGYFMNIKRQRLLDIVREDLLKYACRKSDTGQRWGEKHYGRYVDDSYIISTDYTQLRRHKAIIRCYLKEELGLTLHPKKCKIVKCCYGLSFLGIFVKPHRLYISNRTKKRIFRKSAALLNCRDAEKLRAGINSYLGYLKHFKCGKIKERLFGGNPRLEQLGEFTVHYGKFCLHKR